MLTKKSTQMPSEYYSLPHNFFTPLILHRWTSGNLTWACWACAHKFKLACKLWYQRSIQQNWFNNYLSSKLPRFIKTMWANTPVHLSVPVCSELDHDGIAVSAVKRHGDVDEQYTLPLQNPFKIELQQEQRRNNPVKSSGNCQGFNFRLWLSAQDLFNHTNK